MSDGFIIIDRRKNPKAKSLSNRQRFVARAKKSIRDSAKRALVGKSMSDTGDTYINVPADGIEEPHFRHDPSVGEYDYVLPGNQEYIVGDMIGKPPKQDGGGKGGGNGEGDGGEDEFNFALSYEEYLNVIFDDLELPDLIKKTERNTIAFVNRRAGYTASGMPSNLNAERTAVAGMARRIALKAPKMKRIHELEAELADLMEISEVQVFGGEDKVETNRRILELENEITSLRAKATAIAYLDNVDMRYNNFVKQPKPITQAVMFCMMDVSYSMGEREKIIAKKFFILLHLFLKRRYENIDVVFVRHHDKAEECDEDTFFTGRVSGGTVVSTGYDKIKEIIASRYNSEDWNIYMAQASDGDNFTSDNDRVTKMLSEDLLPVVQHFTYIEIEDGERAQFMSNYGILNSNLWQTIEPLTKQFDNISCAKIEHERDVIRVFRKLFNKDKKRSEA
jgi:uncharacterized sporulation protein YeaH/YhbH (DUF444 family)